MVLAGVIEMVRCRRCRCSTWRCRCSTCRFRCSTWRCRCSTWRCLAGDTILLLVILATATCLRADRTMGYERLSTSHQIKKQQSTSTEQQSIINPDQPVITDEQTTQDPLISCYQCFHAGSRMTKTVLAQVVVVNGKESLPPPRRSSSNGVDNKANDYNRIIDRDAKCQDEFGYPEPTPGLHESTPAHVVANCSSCVKVKFVGGGEEAFARICSNLPPVPTCERFRDGNNHIISCFCSTDLCNSVTRSAGQNKSLLLLLGVGIGLLLLVFTDLLLTL